MIVATRKRSALENQEGADIFEMNELHVVMSLYVPQVVPAKRR